MDRKSNHSAPVLADPALMNKSRLGIHSSLYSPPGVVFSPGLFITMQRKKSIKLDDVRASSWLDSMKSSSPTHRKIAKDSGTELLSSDAAAAYRNWMLKYPSALSSFENITNYAKGKRLALFLDYDGTLSPIVDNPDCAFMSNAMRAAVRNVAKCFPTAIISGRSRDKVFEFVGLTELYYAGSHGMDIMGPVQPMSNDHPNCIRSTDKQGKEVNLFQPASEFLPMIDEVFSSLVEITKEIKGAEVENNKFCVSVHYRNVDEQVLEVRPVLDWDKGKAVEFLLESLGLSNCDDVLPIYVGDDRTDEDAFKVLREGNRGYGIMVSSAPKESTAFYSLRDPSEAKQLSSIGLVAFPVSALLICIKVIAVNGKFPGPTLKVTTNYNVIVNVKNKLDENLLITWPGVQMRHVSWQDGVLGTNCPIPPNSNWTYQFQVKDQIVTGNDVPVPFNTPDGDIEIMIGDWYTRHHKALRKALDAGDDLGMPDGVLINGKGPYRYNPTLVPDGIGFETISVEPGEVRVTGVAVLQYSNSQGMATGPLPDPPNDIYDKSFVVNQAMSIRQNLSASGARSNPQGSFHYGSINVTDTYMLQSMPLAEIDGKLRYTLNGISFVNPDTPISLADEFKLRGEYKLDFPTRPLSGSPRMDRMGYGEWTESRGSYNLADAIFRCTTQVFPGGWTAIMVSLDNVGVWNLRAENLDRWYLGQETYVRTVNPEENNTTELAAPDNVLYCGALGHLQRLILRGLLSSAQQVIQRIILQCSSVSDAISAVDFVMVRGMELDSCSYGVLMHKLVNSGEFQLAKVLYNDGIVSRGIDPDTSILNSMVGCYCKLGELEEAKSHFDRLIEMNCVPCKGACIAFLRELSAQNRFLEAFDYFVGINDAGILLGIGCYNRLIDGLCLGGYLDEALHVFDIMRERGVLCTVHLWKLLVHSFCKRGRVEEAELLGTEMESQGLFLDKVMYTNLINGYCKNKRMKMAMRVFLKMHKTGCEPDSFTYNTLIHGFVNLGLPDKGWVLHNQMVESGIKPNAVTYHVMIRKYCKEQNADCALTLLDNMRHNGIAPTVHCYTVLIAALHKENRLMEVDDLYYKMLDSGVVPDHIMFFTLTKMYPKGLELKLALMLLQAIARVGCHIDHPSFPASDASDSTTVLELEIEHLLGEIVRSNSYLADAAFSIYIMALCAAGKTEGALICMDKMFCHGCQPLLSTYNSLIKSLFQEGLVEGAKSLYDLMQDRGIVPNLVTYLIIIHEHCKRGDLASAFDILDQMDEKGLIPSVAIYDCVIGRLSREKRISEAQHIFKRMLEAGVDPDEFIYVTMINAYSKNGRAIQACQLFDKMVECGIQPSFRAYTALINGNITFIRGRWHVTHNNAERAREVMFQLLQQKSLVPRERHLRISIKSLEEIKFIASKVMKISSRFMPNLYLYNGMISGLCWANRIQDAYDHLELMQRDGVCPNQVTFTILIDGHIRFGEIDSAILLFNKMNEHGCIPDRIVYNTLIRGLCQAGRLLDALSLSHTMHKRGFFPSKGSYENLLNRLCASRLSVNALRMCEDMLAHDFIPCRYNLNWLLCLLSEEDKLDEAQAVHDLLICKRSVIYDVVHRRGQFLDKSANVLVADSNTSKNSSRASINWSSVWKASDKLLESSACNTVCFRVRFRDLGIKRLKIFNQALLGEVPVLTWHDTGAGARSKWDTSMNNQTRLKKTTEIVWDIVFRREWSQVILSCCLWRMVGPHLISLSSVLGLGDCGFHEILISYSYEDCKKDICTVLLTYPLTLASFEKITNCAKGKKLTLFLDYGRTLSPIVDYPDCAFMSNAMRAVVRKVAKCFPTAIISGRSLNEIPDNFLWNSLFCPQVCRIEAAQLIHADVKSTATH
ncbi:hypothetical protein Acr_02g0002150 [Actinidia rufa]|uniref:Trehalose-phosphatase n=1 Tax=Actinidia rufa TaxID=165716 RepID=A0A7J0E6J6_9ERIC|nr:hypothetical protein Acr_02g0002150 [Actinidia rufa]